MRQRRTDKPSVLFPGPAYKNLGRVWVPLDKQGRAEPETVLVKKLKCDRIVYLAEHR